MRKVLGYGKGVNLGEFTRLVGLVRQFLWGYSQAYLSAAQVRLDARLRIRFDLEPLQANLVREYRETEGVELDPVLVRQAVESIFLCHQELDGEVGDDGECYFFPLEVTRFDLAMN